MGRNEIFSIRQMVELTGLSEFTIRGWENRYSAFEPRRTETGRREYTKDDIERALLLRELLKRGQKIGKIATLNRQRLRDLFEICETKSSEGLVASSQQGTEKVAEVLELMALQKWADLEAIFRKIQGRKSKTLIHQFFLPVVQALSKKVESGLVSIAQEHILSSLLKEAIYACLTEVKTRVRASGAEGKTRFVLAAPEGDYHEIGLLLAHLLIRSYGFPSLYLGPHVPSRDLSETVLRFEAPHLLIVSTVSKKEGAKQELLTFISEVQNRIGSQTRILIAGSQAPQMGRYEKSSVSVLSSFKDLEDLLIQYGGRRS